MRLSPVPSPSCVAERLGFMPRAAAPRNIRAVGLSLSGHCCAAHYCAFVAARRPAVVTRETHLHLLFFEAADCRSDDLALHLGGTTLGYGAGLI